MAYNKLITPASSFPVTLAELKAHLAIDGTDHDDRLTDMLEDATAFCEAETGRSFITQTRERVLCCFPCHQIELPFPPLQSVTSVKYYDSDNVLVENFTGFVSYAPHSQPGWIEPTAETTWPDTFQRSDAVIVRYVSGNATPPPQVRRAILMLCGTWNELREGEVTTATKQVELGVQRLLKQIQWRPYV